MKLRDSFSNKLYDFKKKQVLNIYLCGPTVYDRTHIGNLRPVIIFDILNRILKLNHNINYFQNITDIDDKIIKKAQASEKKEEEVAEFYFKQYLNVLKMLKIDLPNSFLKVSENIDIILKFIDLILQNGYGYLERGDVYFSIKKWDKYEKINNFLLDELKTGNSSIEKRKINSYDFALWKNTNDKGKKFFSPWGDGRPGWHTECAAMIDHHFAKQTIDIHGGGIDLRFPHHVNERAQFEAINNRQLAKVWMHIGYVIFNKEKMSKSLNNIFYTDDFLKEYSANILRFFLISSHYKKPIVLNENSIGNAVLQIKKIKNLFIKLLFKKQFLAKDFKKKIDLDFLEIVNYDLNLPNAISLLNKQIKILNTRFQLEVFQKFLFNLFILGIDITIDFDKLKKNKKELKIDFLNKIINI